MTILPNVPMADYVADQLDTEQPTLNASTAHRLLSQYSLHDENARARAHRPMAVAQHLLCSLVIEAVQEVAEQIHIAVARHRLEDVGYLNLAPFVQTLRVDARSRLAGHARRLDQDSVHSRVGVQDRPNEMAGATPDVDHRTRAAEVVGAHHGGRRSRSRRALGRVKGPGRFRI